MTKKDTQLKGARIGVNKTYKLYINGKFTRTESGRIYKLKLANGETISPCRASKKDHRNAVQAARSAFGPWSKKTAYNRAQILYRIAEIMEARSAQLVKELISEGQSKSLANKILNNAIDTVVHYAGWADKYQQLFSSVNPVSAPYFNFSTCEPMGVIGCISKQEQAFSDLVGNICTTLSGGNTIVILAAENSPLSSITFAEILETSDVPGGVVNILTGKEEELWKAFSDHLDVNAIIHSFETISRRKALTISAANNIKRVIERRGLNWLSKESRSPYLIMDTQEIKTIWHPIAN